MTWFKVDDRFWGHPKVAKLSLSRWYHEAVSAWVLCGSWASSVLSDGRIPSEILTPLRIKTRAAEALCNVGLWERDGTGYRFVDWAQYQPASAQVRETRRATRERVARFREAKRQQRNAVTEPVTDDSCNAVRNGGCTPSPIPIPILKRENERDLRSETHTPDRAGARACAWTAERQQVAFRAAWLSARDEEPSMGGRNVGDFHRRVISTAQARNVEPAALFGEMLEKYLSRELSDRELESPYACFAQRWGSLVSAGGTGRETADLREMQASLDESLRRMGGTGHHGGR